MRSIPREEKRHSALAGPGLPLFLILILSGAAVMASASETSIDDLVPASSNIHENGHLNDHNNDHLNGHDIGHLNGHDNGQLNGHNSGHLNGLDSIQLNGHSSGHLGSHDNGHLNGHDGGQLNGHDGGQLNGHNGGHHLGGKPRRYDLNETREYSFTSSLLPNLLPPGGDGDLVVEEEEDIIRSIEDLSQKRKLNSLYTL